jgi:hypothetical protein
VRPNIRHKGQYGIYRVLLSVSLTAKEMIHSATKLLRWLDKLRKVILFHNAVFLT